MRTRNLGFGLGAFVVGAVLGGVATLLSIPAARKEAGEAISNAVETGMGRLRQTCKRLRKRTDEVVEAGMDFAEKLVA